MEKPDEDCLGQLIEVSISSDKSCRGHVTLTYEMYENGSLLVLR